MPPIMSPARKFQLIEEMLDQARRTGRFETATKFQRHLLAAQEARRQTEELFARLAAR
jgi:hypothetical protein